MFGSIFEKKKKISANEKKFFQTFFEKIDRVFLVFKCFLGTDERLSK